MLIQGHAPIVPDLRQIQYRGCIAEANVCRYCTCKSTSSQVRSVIADLVETNVGLRCRVGAVHSIIPSIDFFRPGVVWRRCEDEQALWIRSVWNLVGDIVYGCIGVEERPTSNEVDVCFMGGVAVLYRRCSESEKTNEISNGCGEHLENPSSSSEKERRRI